MSPAHFVAPAAGMLFAIHPCLAVNIEATTRWIFALFVGCRGSPSAQERGYLAGVLDLIGDCSRSVAARRYQPGEWQTGVPGVFD